MSVRSEKPKVDGNDAAAILHEATSTDAALGEGNSYCVASPDNPLKRNLVVSIRASLNDLCLSKSKGSWSPSGDALKSIRKCRARVIQLRVDVCKSTLTPILVLCSCSQSSRRSSPHWTAPPTHRAT